MAGDAMKAGESRVWLFPDGFGPGKNKTFFGFARIGDPTYGFGDTERIEAPSEDRYNEFEQIDSIQGARERPTASVIARYPRTTLSDLLAIGRKRCASGVQVLIGKCQNPQDYNSGWDKMVTFTDVRYTSWTAENLGALASDEQAATNETGEFSADDLYEIKPLSFGEQMAADVARQVVVVLSCDNIECGDCEEPSDGCQKVFAVQLGTGATPGTLPSVVYSEDGGATSAATDIDSLNSNETPSDATCVGGYFVLVSENGGFHYAIAEDILDGTETWVEVDPYDGAVFPAFPQAISSVGARHTWAVGTGGYIWFATDPTVDWSEQDTGVATAQDLNDVHAFSKTHVVAVGNTNAVVYTTNGGSTWAAVTGPAVGVTLNCVKMYGERVWFVGTAGGELYFTDDSGSSWSEVSLPVTATSVNDIVFYDEAIGYLAITVAGPAGRILRTTDGGANWYVLPEGAGAITDNDAINSLTVCASPNVVWGGGLGANETDGIVVKAA